MRPTRRLTSAERWELGLFLCMLVVGCLIAAAVGNLNNIPHIFAMKADAPIAEVAPVAPQQENAPTPAQFDPPAIQPQAFELPSRNTLDERTAELLQPRQQELAPRAKPAPKVDIKTYKGDQYRYVKTLKLHVTAYAPDPRCCYPYDGTTTASGLSVKTNGGRLVAADTKVIPMHALVVVPGYAAGAPVPVLDRGGAIKGRRLDVLLPTFDKAKDWGARDLEVKIYMPVNE